MDRANSSRRTRTARRGAATFLAAWMLAGVGLWLAGCGGDDDEGLPPPPEDPPIVESMPRESLSPVQIWRKEAGRKTASEDAIAPENVERVATLLLQAEPSADKPLEVDASVEMRWSLRRFLDDERVCFTKTHAMESDAFADSPWLVEGKCYWVAWVLALATKRPAMTEQRSQEIRKDFAALTDLVATQAGKESEAAYRKAFQAKFDKLHGDVLFPALKQPLGAAMHAELAAYVLQARASFLHEAPPAGGDGEGKAPAAKPLPLLPQDAISALANELMIQLVYRTAQPAKTEYWGYMKSADYSPVGGSISLVRLRKPGWPVSLAIVPDEQRNRSAGWRRGQAPATQPATKPVKAPTTQPVGMPPLGSNEEDWSVPVRGLRARVSAGLYIARRLASRVSIQLWSVAPGPIRVDTDLAGALQLRLLDATGTEVPPARRPAGGKPDWQEIEPGQSTGKTLGRSKWIDSGAAELDVGTAVWSLPPGKYVLQGTITIAPPSAGQPEDAWHGTITLKPVTMEVFADVDPERFRAAIAAAKVAQAGKPKAELWLALSELVTPGMTVEDMLLALPPAVRQRPTIDDRDTYLFVSYPVDGEFAVKAVAAVQGTDRKIRTLTSRPRIVRLRAETPPPPVPSPAPAK